MFHTEHHARHVFVTASFTRRQPRLLVSALGTIDPRLVSYPGTLQASARRLPRYTMFCD